FPGRIIRVHDGDLYDVGFDDGDTENYVEPARLRPASAARLSSSQALLRERARGSGFVAATSADAARDALLSCEGTFYRVMSSLTDEQRRVVDAQRRAEADVSDSEDGEGGGEGGEGGGEGDAGSLADEIEQKVERANEAALAVECRRGHVLVPFRTTH